MENTHGFLVFKGTLIYRFTAEDEDLLVRSIFGEEGADATQTRGGLAVAVTMINRWAMMLTLPWYRKLLLQKPEAAVYGYREFNDMLAAYSQPVNPQWLNGGRRDRDPAHEDAAEERRESILTKDIGKFPLGIRELVWDLLCPEFPCLFANRVSAGLLVQGTPEDMVGLVHFYCPAYYFARKLKVSARNLTDEQVTEANKTHSGGAKGLIYRQPRNVSIRSNAFYAMPTTKNWRASDVRIVGPAEAARIDAKVKAVVLLPWM